MSTSGNDQPHRRTPETLVVQRSASQDSRASTLSAHSHSARAPSRHPDPASSIDSPISQGNWIFSNPQPSHPTPRNHHRRLSDQTGQRSQQSPTMIGPTSAFYDPEQALSPDSPDYQRWVEAYGSGPMSYNNTMGGDGGEDVSQFQHHRQQPQRQQTITARQTPTEPVPLQNQYQFVPGQYHPPSTPSSSMDHHNQYMSSSGRQLAPAGSSGRPADYATSIRTHQQIPPSGSLHGAIDYSQISPQGLSSDLYYYPSDIVGSGDQPHAFTFSSGGGSQTYHDPSFTPSSEIHTLPTHTSVSPPWTEERSPQGYGAGPSSAPTPTPRPGQAAGKRGDRPSAKKSPPKKRPRPGPAGDSESESDEDTYGPAPTSSKGPGNVPARLPGACTHCKKLKMKCDFPKNDNTCKRCKAGGHQCIVEGRKPRTAPNKREYLLAQIRQKDSIIESLLKQLHNPYLATPLSIASYRMATSPSDQNNRNIIAWLDRLQASVRAGGVGPSEPAFKLESRTKTEDYSDQESAGEDEYDGDFDDANREGENLGSLPDAAVPLGLIANLSLSNTKAKASSHNGDVASTDTLDDDNVGVANETYFMPGPASDLGMRAMLIEQHSPPEILVHGLVAPEDVDKLFDIFYQRINAFISLLDPVLHTPASTFARCPFLFTVICAISSRYYAEKSEIYPIAMHFAKHAAANALIDGWKSVELCQAYILMSIYAVPARRWEEDRSWLYTGLAIRIATDLNLHQVTSTKPQNERQEREILNRTRVWMICFNLDRSTATQFGKPSTIKEDYVVRHGADWYKKSPYNHKFDIHLCAYSAMLRIVAAFHADIFSDTNTPSGLNKNIDFRSVTLAHDANLTRYHEEWKKRFAEGSDPNDRSSAFRCTLLPFLTNYSRLVMYSFGFQQAYQRGFEPGDEVFFTKCFEAAKAVIKNFIDVLAPSGYMRYSADGHFVFSSFASAFLLKLLRPEFSTLMTKELETEIFELIGRLIQTFSSPDIAIDDRHTPKLYARFLAGLLSRNRKDGATVGRLHPQPPPQSEIAHAASGGYGSHMPASNPSFSVTSPEGDGQGGHDGGFTHAVFNPTNEKADTPIYRPEATYTLGNGPIEFGGSADFGSLALGSSTNGFSDEEMLATMQALKNPQWWSTMMMPGFSWPQDSPMMGQSNNIDSIYSQNIPGLHHQGFGVYQPIEVPLN